MNNKKNIILFTGQSGLQIEHCLKRINFKSEILSIEKKISEITSRRFKEEILSEVPGKIHEHWDDAFNQCIELIDNNESEYYFLTFHAIYYHQRTLNYLPPINFNLIKKLKNRVKCIIVFIDDIYDVYLRLIKEGEMYSHILSLEPQKALIQSIYNLDNLLNWRQIEIAYSRSIAKLLNIKMFVIAIKHPRFIIERIIKYPINELEIYYLSHPISEIRRKFSNEFQTFPGELNSFLRNLEDYPKKIIFIPTTIDEYRIKKKDKVYLPELNPRWALYFDPEDLINNFTQNNQEINPLNPLNYNFNYIENHNSISEKSISQLLELLNDKIYRQIGWRDLTLVEQSKNGLILYRPHFGFKEVSGGVKDELTYNKTLYIHGEKERTVYVLTLEKELIKSRIFKFLTKLIEHLEITISNKNIEEIFIQLKDSFINNEKWIEFFSSKSKCMASEQFIRDNVENQLEGINYSFKDEIYDICKELNGSFKKGIFYKDERKKKDAFHYLLEFSFDDILKDLIINNENYRIFNRLNEIQLKEIFNN